MELDVDRDIVGFGVSFSLRCLLYLQLTQFHGVV